MSSIFNCLEDRCKTVIFGLHFEIIIVCPLLVGSEKYCRLAATVMATHLWFIEPFCNSKSVHGHSSTTRELASPLGGTVISALYAYMVGGSRPLLMHKTQLLPFSSTSDHSCTAGRQGIFASHNALLPMLCYGPSS